MSSVTNRTQSQPSYSAVLNAEEDDIDQLTEREIKYLKRQARKRKWVRRLQTCNDYLHGLCKLYIFENAFSLGWPRDFSCLQN